jgi:hypothetical protein
MKVVSLTGAATACAGAGMLSGLVIPGRTAAAAALSVTMLSGVAVAVSCAVIDAGASASKTRIRHPVAERLCMISFRPSA